MSDLISRADAIEAVIEEWDGYAKPLDSWDVMNRTRAVLETLPSADAVKYESTVTLNSPISISADAEVYEDYDHATLVDIKEPLKASAKAEAEQRWIPCSERLPKINQRVLLATNEGRVFVGYKEKPDLVWRVTDADGREHWVYDPEHYTDDIDILLKEDDCSFSEDNQYSDGFLSVTSINYDDRFEGVTAWMPLPKPYREDGEV